MMRVAPIAVLASLLVLVTACVGLVPTGGQEPSPSSSPRSPSAGRPAATAHGADPAQAVRLQRVMLPLIRVMDHPVPLTQLKVGIVEDPQINAANTGGGEFFVTTGLFAADQHSVLLLRRAGYPKEMMIDTLTWLMQASGPDSGGFFATHPGTADRIVALRKLP